MANSRQFGGFADGFMNGFSFIDQANSRKRQERLLDERLAEERSLRTQALKRQERLDAENAEDRAFNRTVATENLQNSRVDRSQNEANRQFEIKGSQLAADPNSSLEDLQQLAPFSQAAADEVQRRTGEQRFAQDLGGLQDIINPQVTQQPSTTPPSNQGLSGGGLSVQVPEIPGNELAPDQGPALTGEALANTDLQAAMSQRDANTEDLIREFGPQAGNVPQQSPRDVENRKRETKRQSINTEWEGFNNINDRASDEFRNTAPSALTGKYFDDRSNLDSEVRATSDQRMAPVINQTIQEQTAALSAAEPGSREARNASRKLGQSISLAREIGIDYRPATQAGINARGLPVGNGELVDRAVTAIGSAPGTPGGLTPRQMQTAATVVSRISNGASRLNNTQLTNLGRLVKAGAITMTDVRSIMMTGQLAGAAGTLTKLADGEELYRTDANGNTRLVASGGGGSSSSDRFQLTDDGLAEVNRAFEKYGDAAPGLRQSFAASLNSEAVDILQSINIDLSTATGAAQAVQLWEQHAVIREDYNAEIWADGEFFPDFDTNFGNVWESIAGQNRGRVQAFRDDEADDFFGDDNPLAELPASRTGGADIDYIRQQLAASGVAELVNLADTGTPQEIEAVATQLLEQQLAQ